MISESESNPIYGRVLLLNATYEVIGTISVARAIKMSMRKANPVVVKEIVETRQLRTAGGISIDVPSVVVVVVALIDVAMC